MGLKKFFKRLEKNAKQGLDVRNRFLDLHPTVNEYEKNNDDGGLEQSLNAAAQEYGRQLTETEISKVREDYEKRRKAKKTQTILTSGSGASGTPATSRPTLLGG